MYNQGEIIGEIATYNFISKLRNFQLAILQNNLIGYICKC